MSNYTDIEYKIHIKKLIFSSLIGYIIFILYFPLLSHRLIDSYVSIEWLNNFLHINIKLFGAIIRLVSESSDTAFFEKVMTGNFILILVYLLSIILLSARQLKIQPFTYSCFGIFFGYISIHIISWLSVIILRAVSLLISIFIFIKSLILKIYNFFIISFNFLFINNFYITLFIIALIIGFIYRNKPIKAIKIYVVILFAIFTATIIIPMIYTSILDFIQPAIDYINNIWLLHIKPLISLIFFVFSKLLAICVYFFILSLVFSTIGNIVLDQFRSSVISGYGGKASLLSGFSIGSAFSIVTLSSVATIKLRIALNSSWENSFSVINNLFSTNLLPITESVPTEIYLKLIPESVENFINFYLSSAQAPIVDSLILFFVLLITIFNIMRTVFSANDIKYIKHTDINFMPRDFIIIFSLLFASILLIFFQAVFESN